MPTAREINTQTNTRRQALAASLSSPGQGYRLQVLNLTGALAIQNRSLNIVIPQDAHLASVVVYNQGTALLGTLTGTLLSPAFPDGSLVVPSTARWASSVVLGSQPAYLLPAGSTITAILEAPSQVAAGLRADLVLTLMPAPK